MHITLLVSIFCLISFTAVHSKLLKINTLLVLLMRVGSPQDLQVGSKSFCFNILYVSH